MGFKFKKGKVIQKGYRVKGFIQGLYGHPSRTFSTSKVYNSKLSAMAKRDAYKRFNPKGRFRVVRA